MEFFVLLTGATVAIAVLAGAVYRRCRDVGTLVGIAALYYWSLFGAWYIVIDKTGGFSGKNYQYLEGKLFPIALDQNYLLALALYAGFILLVEITLLALALPAQRGYMSPITLRHEPILLIGFAAAAASALLMADKLGTAWTLNVSAYAYTRSDTGTWFTLHQVLNRVAMIPPALGLAALAAGRDSRTLVSSGKGHALLGYLALLGCMGVFTFVLGNKNEVLTALLAGVLAYIGSARKPNWVGLGFVTIAGLWFLYTIDLFRGVPLAGLRQAVVFQVEQSTDVAHFLSSSNEAYGAHFSMYGVLATDVRPRLGYSLYSLACSIIPRAFWPDRPADIYNYYADSVGAVQNQGYSLHHATGWYLNFGYPGVALGAIVMGLVWAYCLNARRRAASGVRFRLFAATAPWLFAACLPALIRAGPEGYKGFLVEGVLIPVAVLAVSCRPKKARMRIGWHPERGSIWGTAR